MPKLQLFLAEESPSTHDLPEEKITVGRLPDNTLQIVDESISSHHAELVFENGHFHLHDLGSTNGTFLNGEPVTDAVLKDGDQVRFGKVDSVFNEDTLKTGTQPPPETKEIATETGVSSTRPIDFVNTSPFPKDVQSKDPLAMAAIALSILGLLGFAASLYGIFILMQSPSV